MAFDRFITEALQEVSVIAKNQFGKVSGSTKPGDNNQVLTATDLAIGQHLISRLHTEYPDHNIIDEEAGVIDKGSDYTWVIDPIDGTSNFAQGIPTYGCMIGLLENDQPIAGGIALPAFDQLYVATKGNGTHCNGQKISVTTESELKKTLIAYGIDGHPEAPELTQAESRILSELVLAIRNLRTSNSVFDIAMLVSGRYGAALNRTSKIWDNVAQHIVVEEAGGLYTDFEGQPIQYSQPLTRAEANFTYCAANPTLHTKVQEILAKVAN